MTVTAAALALLIGLSMGLLGGGGSIIAGARLGDHTQLTLLATLMFVAAIAMWRKPALQNAAARPRVVVLIILGVVTGIVTGLVGIGGGFLIVPALVIGARLPIRQAAAASLFVITLAAFASIPGYVGRMTVEWSVLAPFAAIAAAGALAGGMTAHYLPQRRLQQVFAIALVVLGSYVLTRA